jgi:hypothetical protein
VPVERDAFRPGHQVGELQPLRPTGVDGLGSGSAGASSVTLAMKAGSRVIQTLKRTEEKPPAYAVRRWISTCCYLSSD